MLDVALKDAFRDKHCEFFKNKYEKKFKNLFTQNENTHT